MEYNGYGILFETISYNYKKIKYEGQFKDRFYHGLGKGNFFKINIQKFFMKEIL